MEDFKNEASIDTLQRISLVINSQIKQIKKLS
jgi:hypothetical protein